RGGARFSWPQQMLRRSRAASGATLAVHLTRGRRSLHPQRMADTFPVHAIRAQSYPNTNRPVTCREPAEINVLLRSGGLEAIALHVLVGDAPYRPAGSRKEKFLDGYTENVDSKKIRDVVI